MVKNKQTAEEGAYSEVSGLVRDHTGHLWWLRRFLLMNVNVRLFQAPAEETPPGTAPTSGRENFLHVNNNNNTYYCYYTIGHKECGVLLPSVSSPNIDQFSIFFHWHTLRTICNNAIIIYLTTHW